MTKLLSDIEDVLKSVEGTETAEEGMQAQAALANVLFSGLGNDFPRLRFALELHAAACVKAHAGEARDQKPGVYVIEYADGMLKVGSTHDFPPQMVSLFTQTASPVVRQKFFPCNFYRSLEGDTYRALSEFRVRREFFYLPFDECCQLLEELSEQYGASMDKPLAFSPKAC